jgi:hypothetical protein
MVSGSQPSSWFQDWIAALTKPNEQTYASLASSPGASANKAYLWVFIAALVNFILVSLLQGVFMSRMAQQFGSDFGDFGSGFGSSLVAVICGAPIGAAFSVLFFAIGVAIIQWIAGMFGGKGNTGQLAYAMGAIVAPYMLVSSLLTLLAAIPYVGYCFSAIGLLAGLYILVLEIMAVKGVNQFGWGPAIGSVLLPGLVVFFLCACLAIALFALLGPMVGDVFSTINQSLGGF